MIYPRIALNHPWITKIAIALRADNLPLGLNPLSKAKQTKELALWQDWKSSGHEPAKLSPLLDSIAPIIQREVRKYRGVEIPTSALEAEALKQTVKNLKTFDPSKAALNTHLMNNLRLSRYVKTYQNIGRIPDRQRDLITPYKSAHLALMDELGYTPTPEMLAERVSEITGTRVTPKHIKQLEKEQKGALIASELAHDPSELTVSNEMRALGMLKYDTRLSPLEKDVLIRTHGFNEFNRRNRLK